MKRRFLGYMAVSFLIFIMLSSTVRAEPGGGVWFTDGEENVVLWESKIDAREESTPGYGDWDWINKRTSTIRYKAESVSTGTNAFYGSFVNVTGAYYEVDGSLTPAPDYQNSDSFSPWSSNSSDYINDTAWTQYKGFWNAKDASMNDLPDEFVPLVFVNSPIMLVAIFIWVFDNVFEIDTSEGDKIHYNNSTTVTERKDRTIKFTVDMDMNVELLGSYPTQSDAWTNSSLTMSAEVIYGSETNVLHTFLMDIDMSLSKWNNDTKSQDESTSEYRHSMYAKYPGEVYQDRNLGDIAGFDTLLLSLIGVTAILVLIRAKKPTIKK